MCDLAPPVGTLRWVELHQKTGASPSQNRERGCFRMSQYATRPVHQQDSYDHTALDRSRIITYATPPKPAPNGSSPVGSPLFPSSPHDDPPPPMMMLHIYRLDTRGRPPGVPLHMTPGRLSSPARSPPLPSYPLPTPVTTSDSLVGSTVVENGHAGSNASNEPCTRYCFRFPSLMNWFCFH